MTGHTIAADDKRLLPEFGPVFWAERVSEREWRYCKYCFRDVPTFVLREGLMGSMEATGSMRCCWECGSGIQRLEGRTDDQ